MRKPAREAAELLGVTQRTIFNILCGFRRNGNVLPYRIGRLNVMASIAREEAFILMVIHLSCMLYCKLYTIKKIFVA